MFIFSISLWFSLERLYLSRNLSISSRLSILLAYSCSQPSLTILGIYVELVVTFPFSFLILLIWVLFFFLMSLAQGLSILFIFSKNLAFSFIYFGLCFIYFCSFMITFLPLTLGFVCSSLVVLGVWLGCLFDFFLEVRWYCYKLTSWNGFCCTPWLSMDFPIVQMVKNLLEMQDT